MKNDKINEVMEFMTVLFQKLELANRVSYQLSDVIRIKTPVALGNAMIIILSIKEG